MSGGLPAPGSSVRSQTAAEVAPANEGRPLSASRRRRSSSRIACIPHDVSTEQPPEDLFNQPHFQRGFAQAKQAVGKLAEVLGSGSLHNEPDSTMRRLRDKALELSTFQCPSTRTIGFVGDSGVGKSSLLNSLLHTKDLARSSGSGTACTCVVTEYHYQAEDGFTIEVEWFTEQELQAQLAELLGGYRRYHFHRNDMSGEEQENFKKRAGLAMDTFKAMFGHRLGDGAMLLEHIEEDDARDEARILATLQDWAEAAAASNMSYQTQHDTLEQCSNALAQLTTELSEESAAAGQARGSASWPYIKKIRWDSAWLHLRVINRLANDPAQSLPQISHSEQGCNLGGLTGAP
jgi:ATPase subunit of ABC transporter with duplicated ATPase domains